MAKIFSVLLLAFSTAVFANPGSPSQMPKPGAHRDVLKGLLKEPAVVKFCDRPLIESRAYEVLNLGKSKEGKDAYLLQIPCTEGAYNMSFLFAIPETPLKIIMFPYHPDFQKAPLDEWSLEPFVVKVGARHVDQKKRQVYVYVKASGDGTRGHFHRYTISPDDLLPRLDFTIVKSTSDHKTPYHFSKDKLPKGRGWTRLNPQTEVVGCIADPKTWKCAATSENPAPKK